MLIFIIFQIDKWLLMIEINLKKNVDDNFGRIISSIIELMDEINKKGIEEDIVLNYSEAKFTHPFFTLPLLLLKKNLNTHYGYNISISKEKFKNGFVNEHMTTIHFPEFLRCEEMSIEEIGFVLKGFENKSYLPLIQFPIGGDMETISVRDTFIQHLKNLVCKITDIDSYPGLKSPILYFIDELLSNIIHHAKFDNGYIMAQHYKTKGYIDICIADIGRTLMESYQEFENNKYDISNHKSALESSLKGKSTKGGIDRGYGISTSINMLCKGLGGRFFMFSGNAFTVQEEEKSDIIETNLDHIFWKGVLICPRIPCDVPKGFNYLNYLE